MRQMDMMVTLGSDEALEQATMTASTYLRQARNAIDDLFGPGYAKAHPELVAAYMQTAARDFHTASSSFSLQEISRKLSGISDAITEATSLYMEQR